MEFYFNGEKASPVDMEPEPQYEDTTAFRREPPKRTPPMKSIEDKQISWIHIWGTVYVVKKFLQSKEIEINEQWDNCPKWVNNYTQVQEYIERQCASGMLEIRASDTLEPILEWLRRKDWNLEGIETLEIGSNSILVAMRSHLKIGSGWIQKNFNLTTDQVQFNTTRLRSLNIENAIIREDKFGNIFGFYRYQHHEIGTVTIRLTRLENGTFEEVMENHLTDEGSKTPSFTCRGISFLPIKKKLTTAAMRDLNGATNGNYQVKMVASDGILELNHQIFNYEMKSLALVVYRGGERNISPDGYYMFYQKDESGNATLDKPIIFEVIHNGVNIISTVITEQNIGCSE
jgi:hypothetical protein